MDCFFDPEDNFKLTITASFQSINRHPIITDERSFTMISGEAWDNYFGTTPWVEIFETSSCVGEEQDGIVKFEEMVLKITRNMNKNYLRFFSNI